MRLHGGVPTAKRGDLMDRFRDDDSVQVFISTDAGGTGLNLQSASVRVNLDVPWNAAVLDQRIARVHRLGQKEKVQVILMVASDAYEERVLRLVAGKRDLFDNVVDPEAAEDVVFVKGPVSGIPSYTWTDSGLLAGADAPVLSQKVRPSVDFPTANTQDHVGSSQTESGGSAVLGHVDKKYPDFAGKP